MTTLMVESIGLAIIEAVAEIHHVDSNDLHPPLAEIVDPDALETIFQDDTGELRFSYHGCQVSVSHDGTVEVTPMN